MDPLLLFILELVIIAAMLYLYLWLRAVSRRVEDRELDAKLDDLEESVAETTHWLERASEEVRGDIEARTENLQKLLREAEELVESVRGREGMSPGHSAVAASPGVTTGNRERLEPHLDDPRSGAGVSPAIQSDGSGDEPPQAVQGQTPAFDGPAGTSEREANDSEAAQPPEPAVWRPPQLEDNVSALIDAAVAEGGSPEAEPDAAPGPTESAPEPAQAELPVEPTADPAKRRQRIIELVEQGLPPVEIAEQLSTSRAEVEMVMALHRRRR